MRIQFEFYSVALSLSLASLTCCRDAYQCRSQIIFAFPNSLFRFVCALGLAALVCVRHVAEPERGSGREGERALSATVCGVSQQTSFVACGASFALRYFLPVEPSTLTCLDVYMDKAISMSCWKYKQDSNNNNTNNITKTNPAKIYLQIAIETKTQIQTEPLVLWQFKRARAQVLPPPPLALSSPPSAVCLPI